jgi:hypothetical protein
MQWFITFALLLGVLCMLWGWRKSAPKVVVNEPRRLPLHHCSNCGWTTEQVQACSFERGHKQMVAQLCFDCAIEREAIPSDASSKRPYFVGISNSGYYINPELLEVS